MKAAALEVAAALRAGGHSPLAAARALDLNPVTLGNWDAATTAAHEMRPAAMVPETMVEQEPPDVMDAERREPVVHGPLGIRVEGLDVPGVADLIRKLS